MALSVEYRTCDQEVVGSSLGRARGVETLHVSLTKQYKLVRPKGGDALRLGWGVKAGMVREIR